MYNYWKSIWAKNGNLHNLGLVSDREPRSMVTVDMLVDSWSISRSMYPPSVGQVSVDHRPLYG